MGNIIINEESHEFKDPVLSGTDLILSAGKHPATDYVAVIVGNGTAKVLGSSEKVSTDDLTDARILVEKADRVYRATLNEREFEWPRRDIAEEEIRFLGGVDDTLEIYLDSARDRTLSAGEKIQLSKRGVERFRTREIKSVTFYVNGTEVSLKKGKYSFVDIVLLAFPSATFGAGKCYTVGWDEGPRREPSGELTEGETLRIVEGMIIDVSATDKS